MANDILQCVHAEWPAATHVRAFTTTRNGGTSEGAYDWFNLAVHVGDQLSAVTSNRQLLKEAFELPAEPHWLQQTHSNHVIDAASCGSNEADAAWSSNKNVVCAVLTADCLPVFFTDTRGTRVAVAHAGWRGLLNGVISKTFSALKLDPEECLVWLGPAIGADAFEVGPEVRQSFMEKYEAASQAFREKDEQHWLCDIYKLARMELQLQGVTRVFGGDLCTFSDADTFYSYRRDGQTGRMASLIWRF